MSLHDNPMHIFTLILYMMKWKFRELNVSGRVQILFPRPYEPDSRLQGQREIDTVRFSGDVCEPLLLSPYENFYPMA